MSRKCVVECCQRAEQDLFPSPDDPAQLEAWKTALTTEENKFHVCSLHFDDRFIIIKKVLRESAVPSVLITRGGGESYCECCCRTIKEFEMKLPMDERFKVVAVRLLDVKVSFC